MASCACRTSALAQSQVIPRPETPGLSSAVPGARPPPAAPSAPKAKPNKSRAQLEGEERKRGPAGRTSMYKVRGARPASAFCLGSLGNRSPRQGGSFALAGANSNPESP